MSDRRTSLGERGQQRVAMRDRFVAGDGQPAAQTTGGHNRGGGQRHPVESYATLAISRHDLATRLDIVDEMVLIECGEMHT